MTVIHHLVGDKPMCAGFQSEVEEWFWHGGWGKPGHDHALEWNWTHAGVVSCYNIIVSLLFLPVLYFSSFFGTFSSFFLHPIFWLLLALIT